MQIRDFSGRLNCAPSITPELLEKPNQSVRLVFVFKTKQGRLTVVLDTKYQVDNNGCSLHEKDIRWQSIGYQDDGESTCIDLGGDYTHIEQEVASYLTTYLQICKVNFIERRK